MTKLNLKKLKQTIDDQIFMVRGIFSTTYRIVKLSANYSKRNSNFGSIKSTYHTTYPKNRPSQEEWLKEFKVSSQYVHPTVQRNLVTDDYINLMRNQCLVSHQEF